MHTNSSHVSFINTIKWLVITIKIVIKLVEMSQVAELVTILNHSIVLSQRMNRPDLQQTANLNAKEALISNIILLESMTVKSKLKKKSKKITEIIH